MWEMFKKKQKKEKAKEERSRVEEVLQEDLKQSIPGNNKGVLTDNNNQSCVGT